MIDTYCERAGPGLFAEPLNAATSLAFFVAAWLSWRHARANGLADSALATLVALDAGIGAGSVLFHMFHAAWARLLDIVPILLFQVAFVWIYARRVLGVSAGAAATLAASLVAVALSGRLYPDVLNGSLIYVPALVVLAALGAHELRRGRRPAFAVAAGIFVGSFVLRSIDLAACAAFPIGTHFLWHLLNAAVLYFVFRGLTTSVTEAAKSVHPVRARAVAPRSMSERGDQR